MLVGIISPDQAFSGFSNEAPIAVAALLILARAVDVSGVFQPIVRVLFGRATGKRLMARVAFPIAALSGFVNNTTLVAMAVPPALDLCQRRGLLLPDRGRSDEGSGGEREFAFSMRVRPGGAADGRPVEEAGLRHLKGVFLVEIDRDGKNVAPVAPEELLAGGDVLTFVGRIDHVVDLQRLPGLQSTENRQIDQLGGGSHRFYEVVVANSLNLVGRTLRDVGFQATYGGAVLAIHRSGQRIDAKLGDVQLHL